MRTPALPGCPDDASVFAGPLREAAQRSLRRVHPERLRSPEGDVRVEGELLSVDKPQVREPVRQSLECNLRLELAQCGAQAVVDPLAKRERLRRVRPLEIELLRLREDGGVAPRRRKPEKELRPLREVDTAESHGSLRDAPPDRDGWVITERLENGARNQLRVGDDRIP